MELRSLKSVIWITVLYSVAYASITNMRPWSELINPPAIAKHPYAAIANEARKAYCGAYRWNQRNNPISPENIGFPNLLQPLTDALCDLPGDPPSLPPNPVDVNNQGSCKCGAYSVTYQNATSDGSLFPPSSFPAYGSINLFRAGDAKANYLPGDFVFSYYGDYPGGCLPEPIYFVALRGATGKAGTSLLSMTPIPNAPSGQCGRPRLPEYQEPVNVPPSIPDIQIPRLPGLPNLTVPVFITPVLVRPEINFSPTLSLDVGGVNFNFNFDGWEISIAPQIGGDIILPPNQTLPVPAPTPKPPIYLPYPVNPPPSGGGGVDCCDDILDAIATLSGRVVTVKDIVTAMQETLNGLNQYTRTTVKRLLDDIQECTCPPEIETASSWTDVQDFQYQNQGDELLFALLLFTTPPLERKSYKTPGGVMVSHSGWFSYGRNRVWGDREDVDYVAKLCVAPVRELDSFTFSLYTGLRCSGTLFRRKKDA